MGSTRVKTPSVFGGAGFFPSTVCKSLVFLFSGLAAQSLHVRMFACMAVCMYVRMYVCMYVCKYIRTYSRIFLCRNIFWILHSLCWTEPIHRHRRRHVTAAISQSLSVFLFCHSWLLQSAVCFQPQLGTCVCFDSARTVHVQCTHSARPQCTGSKRCKYHGKMPLGIKTKKKQVSGYFFVISCNFCR